jgi:glucose-1-phosphatase
MGQYFRKWVEQEGLFPENYRTPGDEVRFYSNAMQRTIATTNYFSSGFFPVADVDIITRQEYGKMDPVFSPVITFLNDEYEADVKKQMEGYIGDLSEEYALLSDVIDFKESEGYKSGNLSELKNGDNEITLKMHEEPIVAGSLKLGTTITDALILQYYEEPDPVKAAFGNELTNEQWKQICSIKETYNRVLFTAPLLAPNLAHPLLKELQSELNNPSRKFSFLCGHDSNLASVLASLGIRDYHLSGTLEDSIPIGSKLVLETWEDSSGKEYLRMRMVYQGTDQLRGMDLLSSKMEPQSQVLAFDDLPADENGLYPKQTVMERFRDSIQEYDRIKAAYNITATGVPDTGVR